VFIAVNSGNEPKDVRSYARSNKVTWPVIIDMDRTFESKIDVNEISVKNIWQFRSIDSNGEIKYFRGDDLAKTAQKLLETAKWEVDATQIPESLMQAHRFVEFGMYSLAADMLNDANTSRDEQVKTGATALLNRVNEQIAAQLKTADQAKQNGEPWKAYKSYTDTKDQFKGYKMEVDLRSRLKELKADAKVKNELSAERQFLTAKNKFAQNGMKRTLVKLKRIVEKYPDTEAAVLSQEAIEKLER